MRPRSSLRSNIKERKHIDGISIHYLFFRTKDHHLFRNGLSSASCCRKPSERYDATKAKTFWHLSSIRVDKRCKNSQVYPQGKLYPRKEKEEKEGKRRKRERNDKSISARRVYMSLPVTSCLLHVLVMNDYLFTKHPQKTPIGPRPCIVW